MRRTVQVVAVGLLCMAAGVLGRAQETPRGDAAPDSIVTLLKLDSDQIARLDRLFDRYAGQRLEEEDKIVVWQEELRKAESASAFDEKRAAAIVTSITEADDRIEVALLKARADARDVLTSDQRNELQTLQQDNQTVHNDRYRQLLFDRDTSPSGPAYRSVPHRSPELGGDATSAPPQPAPYANTPNYPPNYDYTPSYPNDYGYSSGLYLYPDYGYPYYGFGYGTPYYGFPYYGYGGYGFDFYSNRHHFRHFIHPHFIHQQFHFGARFSSPAFQSRRFSSGTFGRGGFSGGMRMGFRGGTVGHFGHR